MNMNKVEEFYKRVICIAGEVCGVDPVDIMSFNREECVNARGILIIILLDKGYSEKVVADLTGLTRRGVNRIKNDFPDRIRRNWMIHMLDREVRNKLGMNKE